MTAAIGKRELLARLHAGYDAFQQLIAPLSEAQMSAPGVQGAWSLRDVVAHFVAHEQFALHELAAARRGERYQHPISGSDAMNAAAVAEHSATPAGEVLHAWEASFRAVVAAVTALREDDFADGSALTAALGDTIDGALANNTYEHYAEHTPALLAWLAQQTGTRGA
ncbi:hypothetical protein SE17_21570 [Kouleothrix aurantiaca]|uniref:DinB-like domain-containing protein n=1 Tax=Kouleothrix aurantiaca TaxID=186479 RepID=A0A0P9DEH5_9CHLR|nr:hypothetical protein SE17_21570 [Kouleothrix aurantiaca]